MKQHPYYVYQLIDPRTNIPFYVGKGKNARMYTHVREVLNNSAKVNTPKVDRIREILNEGLDVIHKIVRRFETNKNAQRYEINQIKKIGRVDKATGPLLNLKTGDEKPIRKMRGVCQYNRYCELVAEYDSVPATCERLGYKWHSSLSNAVRGKIPSYKGFLWCWKGEQPRPLIKVQPVYQWSLDGQLVNRHENAFRAAHSIGCKPSVINNNIAKQKGTIQKKYVFSRDIKFPGVSLDRNMKYLSLPSTKL